jgi:hypothetical protein
MDKLYDERLCSSLGSTIQSSLLNLSQNEHTMSKMDSYSNQHINVLPTGQPDVAASAKLKPAPSYSLLADGRSLSMPQAAPRSRWRSVQGRRESTGRKGYRQVTHRAGALVLTS